ncbi:MAG: class I SAM-dependent methyltransferase family protein [Methanomassiliicoccaceae archaeon]|jgi:tRNA wybutosine-synthesizing protein 2|nr:class I SAM-dependent methyltransferase family protein [Methanomassiliicoccaceae archaeon]
MRLAKVPNEKASEMIPYLISNGMADPGAKIIRSEDSRFVPIYEKREQDVIDLGLYVTDGVTFRRETRSPQNRIKERLAHLPSGVVDELPMKWEFVGDIVILRLNDPAFQYKREIGEAYAAELNARTVCADTGGVSGEFREPKTELLFGESAESIRLENGIRYKFDVTKIMFASGNTDERSRMKNLRCDGEKVIDMFAGIGYFTLPIAKFTGAKKVIACEKNPDSYHYLCENIRINEVDDIVTPIRGDNRLLECTDADRIIMGYIQRTSEFLDKAKEMIRPGGMIHYHDTFYVNEHMERLDTIFSKAFGTEGYRVIQIKEVKSFAPSVSHYVADVIVL